MIRKFLIPTIVYYFVLVLLAWANTKFHWVDSLDQLYIAILSVIGTLFFMAIQTERHFLQEEKEQEQKRVIEILRDSR